MQQASAAKMGHVRTDILSRLILRFNLDDSLKEMDTSFTFSITTLMSGQTSPMPWSPIPLHTIAPDVPIIPAPVVKRALVAGQMAALAFTYLIVSVNILPVS